MNKLKKAVKGNRRDRLNRKIGKVVQFGKERKWDIKDERRRSRRY